ncbi:protein kinase domain-containing protein [Nocardia asteroides]
MGEVRFGGYRLERLLGKGGMGQVWLAYDTVAERRVALKLLPAELAAAEGYRKRFEREAEAVARLRDPHVPRIHRFGEIDGRLYIDMQFVEGSDLASKLAAEGPMPPAVAVGVIAHVAAALDVAHRAGLVHRDVKPSNIVVHPSGFTYLIDFGIAHGLGRTAVTTTGMAIGTLAYMAPERFTGTVDGRADVYSLACVLYECLTGARLYGDTDPAQQMHAHLMATPPRAGSVCAGVPAALDAVIARGLAKDPDERFASAGAFAVAAHAAIGIPAPDTRAVPPPSMPGRPSTKPMTGVDSPANGPPEAPNAHRSENSRPSNTAAADQHSRTSDSKAPAADDASQALPGAQPGSRRTHAPTKILPVPGPAPTLVATKQDWPMATRRPEPSAGQPIPYQSPSASGYARPQPPAPAGYPVARQPYPASRRWYQNGSYATAGRGHASWPQRLLALPARVISPRPGPAAPPYAQARKVFPALQRPGSAPVAQRRPGVPVPRRRPRRRRGLLSKMIGALVVVFLAPFAFAAGCLALIAAGTRTGDSGAPAPTLPPSAVAVEHPGPGRDEHSPEVAPVGSPVRDGKFEFVVTNVDAGVSRIGLQTSAGSFLIVTLEVRNISDETKWFLPLGQRLVDEQNTPFDHNATATMWQNAQQRLGYSFELRPGRSATTQLVFDLPPTATPDHLELHDFVLSDGVRVHLG